MQKIIIIGCPGSGKSTFARALKEKNGLPLYHLDMLYWNADKTTVSKDIFRERLNDILSEEEWIIDGNYGSTMEMRMAECDTVFFLDYPLEVCISGIKERQGKTRPDMPWIEYEDEAEFLEFIKGFERDSRPKILKLLKKYCNKNIIVFNCRKDADLYIEKIR